jgi:hypothetical protein
MSSPNVVGQAQLDGPEKWRLGSFDVFEQTALDRFEDKTQAMLFEMDGSPGSHHHRHPDDALRHYPDGL